MISLFLFLSFLPFCICSDPSDSPFAARPLRIRLVNYEKRYQVRHAPTPPELSGTTNSNGPSIELSEDAPNTVVSSQSYLHSIRKRIRGTKLHTVSTALTHLSSSEPLEGMREVDGSNENVSNTAEQAVRKLFNNSTTPQQPKNNTGNTGRAPEKGFIVENTSTNPSPVAKTRTQFSRDSLPVENPESLPEIIQEPIKGNQSMTAMTELDVKSDEMLQKTFRRTTLAMTDYKVTTPPSTGLHTLPAATNSPVSSTKAPVFTLPPLFAAPNLALTDPPAQTRQPLVQLPTGGNNGNGGAPVQHLTPQFDTPSNLSPRQITGNSQQPNPQQIPQNQGQTIQQPQVQGAGRPNPPPPAQSSTSSRPDLEQLGCGFDLLSQSCKDVFGLGWCAQCTDLGNVFLHDCKCAAPTELGRTANALFTQPPTTTPYNGLGQQSVLQQQIQAQQNALANAQQVQQGQLPGQGQQVPGPQQISTTQHLVQQPSPPQFQQQFPPPQLQQQLPQQPVIPQIPQPQALQGFVQQPTWSL
ncbi:unnamed protein product [Bursaphelenchus xylophilus]|uniref:(pine wood nematode) hypothetical protein n=1 Tax=Bursaphelenchus xylophilus TaxID=6326 RepID=A0A1I7RTR1_BURXY|nr:unnamed protein product [Bursaphelenchus xylophilus]CAG9122200.1 unnamed protein product [Bursaphelenchus xylophilus]